MSNYLDQFALKLADTVIRFRWWVMAATLLVVLGTGSGMRLLQFANNYRVFFGQENPELLAFEDLQATYTKSDNLLFVIRKNGEDTFQSEVGDAVEYLTDRAWQIPFATRVDSVSNFQHTWANEDDLTVEDLLRNSNTLSAEAFAAKREVALAEPLLKDNILSPDASTTAVNVTLQYPEESLTEVPQAIGVARELIVEMKEKYPDLTVRFSGLSAMNNAFAESGQQDVQKLVPLMYLVLIGVMIALLRSFTASLATLLVIGFSSITAMGLTGYLGIFLTPVSVTASTIILTLAIADSIHILVSMQKQMRKGDSQRDALRESIRVNLIPVGITSLTTVIGFLGLNFSDTPPFRHLGNITAMGIIAAWIYSMTFLPALLSVMNVKVKQKEGTDENLMQRMINSYANFIVKRYRSVGIVATVITIGLSLMITRVQLDDQWVEYFDHDIGFRGDVEFAIEHLGGVYVVEYSVEAEGPNGVSDPAYLEKLETFTEWLRTQDVVKHVYSYSDIIKRLNKNLNADNPDFYKIPDDNELAAQYLLLYELSLPYGLDLNDRINVDKSATRVTATLPELTTKELRKFVDDSRSWLQDNAPEHMHAEPSGPSVMFSKISHRNIVGMLKGNSIALVLISGIMIIALRSWKLGLLSLLPNALPLMITFGIWGLLVGRVGMAAATVTSTALGIVVDDTVHLLSKYVRARREKNLSAEAAVRYAFDTVGPAVLITTLILTLGFAVLASSSFLINSQMGTLTGIAIVVALIFDFTVLPALLLLNQKDKGSDHETAQA